MAKVQQEVNELFKPLWTQKARYYFLMGGRGRGGSTAASQYAMSRLIAPDYFRCAIMRAIAGDIRHSIWQELNDRIIGQGIKDAVHITDNDMRIEYGTNSIQAHGFKASSGSHKAKLKSLANYNVVIIEEADEVGEAEFTTLDDSLRTKQGDIMIIMVFNSPPKSHWIIQRFFNLRECGVAGFYSAELKPEQNAVYIGGTHRDNLANLDAFTVEKYQAYENYKPDYYHQVIQGLVPEVVRGKIYNGWQLINSVPAEARLVKFGEDFGWFPDPACAVALYYWNGSYIVDELAYGNFLSNEFLAGEIKTVDGGRRIEVVADSAEPKSIAEQNKYGIRVVGVEKGKGSVEFRIKTTSLKKIYVTSRSKNVWKSYENYAWAEDKDGNPKGEPVHTWSHAMDAVSYAIASLHNKPSDVVTPSAPRQRSNVGV